MNGTEVFTKLIEGVRGARHRPLRLVAMLGFVALIAASCSSDATTASAAAADEQSSVTTATPEVEEVTTTIAQVKSETTTSTEPQPEVADEDETDASDELAVDIDFEHGRNGPAPAGTIRLPELGGIEFELDAERIIIQDPAFTVIYDEGQFVSGINLVTPRATSRDVPIANVDELAAALLDDVVLELVEGESVETSIGVARSFDFMSDKQRLADSNANIQVGERSWTPFEFGKVWLMDTERGVFMITAETEELDASIFDETIATAETILATIEFITIEDEAGGTPIVIETDFVFGGRGGSGTFVITEGADDLGCTGGSYFVVGGPFYVTAEMTCEDGPADGTMSLTFHDTDAPGDGDFNGPFWIDSGDGDLAGLTGNGGRALFIDEDEEGGTATYIGQFTLSNPAPDTAVAEFVAAFGVDDADKAWSFVSDRCQRGSGETPDGYSAFVAGYALDVPGATAENISAEVDSGNAAISYDVHNDSGEFFESYTDQPWVFSDGKWYHDDC